MYLRCDAARGIFKAGALFKYRKDSKGNDIPIHFNTSVLICETCAWEAGGGETLEGVHHRPVKGKKLEKLGQESFLQTVPTIFVK